MQTRSLTNKMRVLALSLLAVLSSTTVVTTAITTPNSNAVSPASPIQGATSQYWAGYVITAPAGSVKWVNGSWADIGFVVCGIGENSTAAAAVGIDGWGSVQIRDGLEIRMDCVNGSPSYSAWYVLASVLHKINQTFISFSAMNGIVTSEGNGMFNLTLHDIGRFGSWSFSILGQDNGATRSSAEWVVCCGAPLTDWGGGYGYELTSGGVRHTDKALIRHHAGPFESFTKISRDTVYKVTMINPSDGHTLAIPSAPFLAHSFTVFHNAGT